MLFLDRKTLGLCFLFKCYIRSSVGQVTPFHVCCSNIPWLDRIKAVSAISGAIKLIFLSGCSGRSIAEASKILCCFDLS